MNTNLAWPIGLEIPFFIYYYESIILVIHTHELLAKRHGPAWSICSQILFFIHSSMLYAYQDPRIPKKSNNKNKK